MVAILDASALLALIQKEPGSAEVVGYLQEGCMSAANYAEVLSVLVRNQVDIDVARDLVAALQVEIVPLTADIAAAAAALVGVGTRHGLSLGDRVCIATAAEFGVPAVTADRIWNDVDLDVEVVCVR